ncbi:MAG: ATP-binding protein, partial [Gammaproteobacteria bacterium]
IGKTRLVEAFGATAGRAGFVCHTERLLDFGDTRGRDPSSSLANVLLDIAPGADAAARLQALAQHAAESDITPAQHALLYDLLELEPDSEDAALLSSMDAEARTEGRIAALSQLVARATRLEPLLLAIEDLHWADADFLHTLVGIAAQVETHPLLLVFSTRPTAARIDTAVAGALHGATMTTLDLGPLRVADCGRLAAALCPGIGDADRDESFVNNCIARSGGNPWFLEQLLRTGAQPSGTVPDSVHGVVSARLDALDNQDRRAAQTAAVLGQRFRLADLRDLLGDSGYDCGALLTHRLVRAEADRYAFTHALVAEGVYATVPGSRRRRLHALAARRFAEEDPVSHAEHLERAEDPRAGAAYLAAVSALAREYRYERALGIVERLLGPPMGGTENGADLASSVAAIDFDSETVFELERWRGDMLRETGDAQTSLAVFERAAHDADEHPARRCRALIGQAAALRVLDRQEHALDVLDEAQTLADALGASYELSEVAYLRGAALFPLGRIDACLAANETALQHARAVGSARFEVRALSGIGDAHYQRGHMRSAADYFERAVALAAKHDLLRMLVVNQVMVEETLFLCGNLDVRGHQLGGAERMAQRIGDTRGELILLDVRIVFEEYEARFEDVLRTAKRCTELAQMLGSTRFEIDALIGAARSSFALGDPKAARRYACEAQRLQDESDTGYWRPWLYATLALLATSRRERDAHLRTGERLLESSSASHNHFRFRDMAIRLSLEDGKWDEAKRHADALDAYVADEPVAFAEFVAERGRALAAHGAGVRGVAHARTLAELLSRCESLRLDVLKAPIAAALADTDHVDR